MSTIIAHVLFVDIVAWSKGSIESQASTVGRLIDALKATPTFQESDNLGLIPTGDGMAALFFGDLTAPARCALELLPALDMPVRMGLHSGPVQRQPDVGGHENFVGDGVNLAKRVLDMAETGEILLSETYGQWLIHSDRWAPLLREHGQRTAKHGVQIRLYRLHPSPPAASDAKRFVLLYKRNAQPDGEVLAMLEKGLAGRGHEAFVDRHLRIGVDWARSIERRIREADAAVVLVSDGALHSEMLLAEVEIAQAAQGEGGKPLLLPVRVGADTPIEGPLKPALAPLHFATWNGPDDDEALLDEIERAVLAPAQPLADPLGESDTGGVSPESPFYVERPSDALFHRSLGALDPILLVKGPRQVGKTSLLARGVRAAREKGWRVAFTDFQKFGGALLETDEAFYRAVAGSVGRQIGFKYDFANEWDPIYGATMNMEAFLRAAVEADLRPLVWMMDEADKLFGIPFASDFFGLVRSWHNSRATDPGGAWDRLCIAIAYATEAHLFIQDLNQSPFNVGRRIDLSDFAESNVDDLNERCGRPLAAPEETRRLLALIGGHPFLVRRAMNVLVGGTGLAALIETSLENDGPFGDHLKRLLLSVSRQEPVLEALRAVLKGLPAKDPEALARLAAAGVIVQEGNRVSLRNELYRSYLSGQLSQG